MKKVIVFLITFLCFIGVNAEELTITPVDVHDSNLYKAGDTVITDGVYDGIGFVAGSDVNVTSSLQYGALAGSTVKFAGSVNKDLYIAGASLTIGGNVSRDLYAAGSTVVVNGTINRNAIIYASTLTISKDAIINGDIKFYGDKINIEGSVIGTVTYYENAKFTSTSDMTIKTNILEEKVYEVSIAERLTNICYSLLRTLFMFLVIAFFVPKLLLLIKKQFLSKKASDYVALCGYGICGMFMIPLVCILLLISNIGVSVGLVGIILYGIITYLSTIMFGYLIGTVALKYLIKKEHNDYLAGLIGITAISLLAYIPYVGTIVSMISLFGGFGIIVKLLMRKENRTIEQK